MTIQLKKEFQKHIRNINDSLQSGCLFEIRKLKCSKRRGTPPQPFPQIPHMTGDPGSLLCRSASAVSLLGDVLTQTSSGTRLSVISKTQDKRITDLLMSVIHTNINFLSQSKVSENLSDLIKEVLQANLPPS